MHYTIQVQPVSLHNCLSGARGDLSRAEVSVHTLVSQTEESDLHVIGLNNQINNRVTLAETEQACSAATAASECRHPI